MALVCGICIHKDRKAIDRQVALGASSQRDIAHIWGISRDALRRHVAYGHVPGIAQGGRKGGQPTKSEALENQALPEPTKEGELDEEQSPLPDLPVNIPQAVRNAVKSAVNQHKPKTEDEWIRLLADSIFLGKYKGRETVVAVAAKAGATEEDVQHWADEAAALVARSWGSSELQIQASLAEWRALRADAKEAKDDAKAADCQKQIDKILQSQIKQARIRDRIRKQRGDITALRTLKERRAYIGQLIRAGVFGRAAVSQQLQICWNDLSPLGFTELVAQAADDVQAWRGTQQARRLTLLGRIQSVYKKAVRGGDMKTALRCVEVEARLDGLGNETDLLTGLAMSSAWRIAAQTLQNHYPDALALVHANISAEESRKRAALAPMTVESSQDG